jgi:hypothetical protein
MKRCKNGTRKNDAGECVKKDTLKRQLKRCANGTRKNKAGECVKKIFITPRTAYAKKHFKNPIKLLNKRNGKYDVLFQVSYKEKQFHKFVGPNDPNVIPIDDCVVQTLFSLGLREVNQAKHNSSYITSTRKPFITPRKTEKYISEIFDIEKKHIVFKYKNLNSYREVDDFFYENLQNNYATYCSITFKKKGAKKTDNDVGGHALVVYKKNNILNYFDPQRKSRKTNQNFFEHSLSNMYELDEYGDKIENKNDISKLRWFQIVDLKEKKQLVRNDCIIDEQ